MRNLLILASLFVAQIALAGDLKGIIFNEVSKSPLDECLVRLMQNDKIISSTRSDFSGNFVLAYKKNKNYTLEIAKSGYKTESVKVFIDDDFILNNKSINLSCLIIKPYIIGI